MLKITKKPKLYIPHGSDESDYVVSGLLGSDPFISHMVQMKAN